MLDSALVPQSLVQHTSNNGPGLFSLLPPDRSFMPLRALKRGAQIHETLDPKHQACLVGGGIKGTPSVTKAAIDKLYAAGWLTQAGESPNFRYDLFAGAEIP